MVGFAKPAGALVTVDGEYDHFEALQPEFEDNLGIFVQRAAADEMAAVGDISRNFRWGDTHSTLALVGGTLIDGTGAPALKDSVVVIQGGKIRLLARVARYRCPKMQ